MRFSTMIYYEDNSEPNANNCLAQLHDIILSIDILLGTKKNGMRKVSQEKRPLKKLFSQERKLVMK